MNVTKIMAKPLKSSFLSCEKDSEEIVKKLFVNSRPYSDQLKKLLIINTKDCLDENNLNYNKIVENTTVKELIDNQYISFLPKIIRKEHEEAKSYIRITFDDFSTTDNPEYRDCIVSFDILCLIDSWTLNDYQLRPFKILGIIDGILNNTKLSGIGTLKFLSCNELPAGEELGGYTLMYRAVHGNDDRLAEEY